MPRNLHSAGSCRRPLEVLSALLLLLPATASARGATVPFLRGDADVDYALSLNDAIETLNHLLVAAREDACLDALDANDDGRVEIADTTFLLGHLFLGTAAPAAPYPGLGHDPTEDDLTCDDGEAPPAGVPGGNPFDYSGPSLYERASPEDRALFDAARVQILKDARKDMLVLEELDESYFWRVSHRVQPLLVAYHYSRDAEFMDLVVEHIRSVVDQRYIHPSEPETWSGWYHYRPHKDGRHLRYMPIHGALAYYAPVIGLVDAVLADRRIAARHGQQAMVWLRDIIEREIPAWDARGAWKDHGNGEGSYVHTTAFPDPDTHEIIDRRDPRMEGRVEYGITLSFDIRAGTTLAYNKVHEFTEVLCDLYRLTGEVWYRERIEQFERFFRNNWRYDPNHVEWNYRDFSGAWDYRDEKKRATWTGYFIHPHGAYYSTDASAIVKAYNLGVLFSRNDIEWLLRTNLEFMHREGQEYPRLINGTCHREEEGGPCVPDASGRGVGTLWGALAQFSEEVRERERAKLDDLIASDHWSWAWAAVRYLITASEPVTWDRRFLLPEGGAAAGG